MPETEEKRIKVYDELKDEILKLMESARKAGWSFSFNTEKYPIVVTFKNEVDSDQLSMIPKEEMKTPQKFHLIVTSEILFKSDNKISIPDGLFTSFRNACKKIVLLYYYCLHHKYSSEEKRKNGKQQFDG